MFKKANKFYTLCLVTPTLPWVIVRHETNKAGKILAKS